jgi:hypothetical protein
LIYNSKLLSVEELTQQRYEIAMSRLLLSDEHWFGRLFAAAVANTLEKSRRTSANNYCCLALDPEAYAGVPDISIDYAFHSRRA